MPPKTLPIFGHPGGDITRGGTRTSAKGTVSSKSGKQALGEALDVQVADLKADGSKSKGKATGKAKAKAQSKRPPKTDESKKLQKDIKAFLSLFKTFSLALFCCFSYQIHGS